LLQLGGNAPFIVFDDVMACFAEHAIDGGAGNTEAPRDSPRRPLSPAGLAFDAERRHLLMTCVA
jgi:acyl-CoA reductase-like NAD-dependent aldehyde dehydrogenase